MLYIKINSINHKKKKKFGISTSRSTENMSWLQVLWGTSGDQYGSVVTSPDTPSYEFTTPPYSVLLYSTKTVAFRIYGFESCALRTIKGGHWSDLVSNEVLCQGINQPNIRHHCSAPHLPTPEHPVTNWWSPYQSHLQTGRVLFSRVHSC